MQIHKSIEEIKERISYFEARLDKINEGINKQLDLPFFERSERVCKFLDVEKRAHSLALNELKWILNEE